MTLPYPALPPSQTQNSSPSGSTMITQRLPCSVRVCTGSLELEACRPGVVGFVERGDPQRFGRR